MNRTQSTSFENKATVSHEQHYSNLRREMAYLIQDATAEVMDVFPGTKPLAPRYGTGG